MQIFKLLSALLDYPDGEFMDNLRAAVEETGDVRALVDSCENADAYTPEERQRLAAFIIWLLAQDRLELEGRYVQTFDLAPEHSLHLTHHIFGEEKTRGPALIDLSEYYRSYGFEHDEKELPDYLPLILEFVSELSCDEARVFLADTSKVLKVLASNLEEAESPYAPIIRLVESQGSLARLAA